MVRRFVGGGGVVDGSSFHFIDELQEFISYCAIKSSCELAKERGAIYEKKKTGFLIENMPLETILQQLGVNTNTLQPSNILHSNYGSNLLLILKY